MPKVHLVRVDQALVGLRSPELIRATLAQKPGKSWAFSSHIVVSCDNGRKLVVVDSVPASQQLNAVAVEEVERAIAAEGTSNGTHGLLVVRLTAPIVQVCVLPLVSGAKQMARGDVRLAAIADDGTVSCFCFRAAGGKWEHVGTPTCLAATTHVHSAAYDSGSGRLVWATETNVFACSLRIEPGTASPVVLGAASLVLASCPTPVTVLPMGLSHIALILCRTPGDDNEVDEYARRIGLCVWNATTNVCQVFVSDYGLIPGNWIPSSMSHKPHIDFDELTAAVRERLDTPSRVSSSSSSGTMGVPHVCCAHCITDEVGVVDTEGRLFVVGVGDNGSTRVRLFCSSPVAVDADDELVAFRDVYCVLSHESSTLRVYSEGTIGVESVDIPTGSGGTASRLVTPGWLGGNARAVVHCGVVNRSGIYLLRQGNITELAKALVNASDSHPTHAATLCHSWGLSAWAAKYSLEALLQLDAAANVAPSVAGSASMLESPALLLAALSARPDMDNEARAIIENWLKSFKPGSAEQPQEQASSGTTTTDDSTDALRRALWNHTLLNGTVVPLVDRYLQASSDYHRALQVPPHDDDDSNTSAGAALPSGASSAGATTPKDDLSRQIRALIEAPSLHPGEWARLDAFERHEGIRVIHEIASVLRLGGVLEGLVSESATEGDGADADGADGATAEQGVSSLTTVEEGAHDAEAHDSLSALTPNNAGGNSSSATAAKKTDPGTKGTVGSASAWYSSNYGDRFCVDRIWGEPSVVDYVRAFAVEGGVFELACRLLVAHAPTRLVPFVNFAAVGGKVTSTSDDASGMGSTGGTGLTPLMGRPRSFSGASSAASGVEGNAGRFHQRALRALSPALLATDGEALTANGVRASATLLCSNYINAAPTAMRLLLRWRLWDDALALLRSRSKQDVEHFELFHVLFASFVDLGLLNEYEARVWQLMPRNYSPRELFTVLRDRLSIPRTHAQGLAHAAETGLWASMGEPEVGSVVPKLLRMLREESRSRLK